jgi:hypothetical protein
LEEPTASIFRLEDGGSILPPTISRKTFSFKFWWDISTFYIIYLTTEIEIKAGCRLAACCVVITTI